MSCGVVDAVEKTEGPVSTDRVAGGARRASAPGRQTEGVRPAGRRGRPAEGTRELIMATAERLFAEHGVAAVSSRQISEAAGQGNNAAVGYHFGSKTDLVRAILRRHGERIEARRVELIAGLTPDARVRDWVECLVRPLTEHLAELGVPSWYARFALQLSTDPALGAVVADERLNAPSMRRISGGLRPSLTALPREVREQRFEMIRHLIGHACADRERALAAAVGAGGPTAADWDRAARLLVDAVSGLLLAPVTAAS
jgi:AcrR family transcriptional regulator